MIYSLSRYIFPGRKKKSIVYLLMYKVSSVLQQGMTQKHYKVFQKTTKDWILLLFHNNFIRTEETKLNMSHEFNKHDVTFKFY